MAQGLGVQHCGHGPYKVEKMSPLTFFTETSFLGDMGLIKFEKNNNNNLWLTLTFSTERSFFT